MRVKMEVSGYACLVCKATLRKGSWAAGMEGGYRHPQCEPVSDPTPTVDDVAESRCDDDDCVCGGDSDVEEEDMAEKGPWFGAMYDGRCSVNECQIYEGDRIRADGEGGYECEDCGSFDEGMDKHVRESLGMPTADEFLAPADGWSTVASQVIAAEVERIRTTPLPTADEFLDPSTVDDGPQLNVSGQPPARYEWRGSQNMGYLVKDPAEGDFRRYAKGTPKGIVRVTTFVKAGSDNKAINDWGKSNVARGAAMRPDKLIQAHGWTWETHRKELLALVAELEEVAGAKVGSDIGTFLHEFTERMDAGVATPEEAPPAYQANLILYREELAKHGFEPVQGLIERTTMIREFGGVVGTLDRVLYHRPSRTYMIGDLKTGKTLDYGLAEIETQLWVYAHGVNQSGVYDWNTDTWCPPGTYGDSVGTGPWQVPTVREDIGVIIHMPVQGKLAGTVTIVPADLERGARRADLCHENRTSPKPKPKPWTWEPAPGEQGIDWDDAFSHVVSDEQATEYWRRAKAAGIKGIELNRLIELARLSLEKYRG